MRRVVLRGIGYGVVLAVLATSCDDPAAPDGNATNFAPGNPDSVFIGRAAHLVTVSTFDGAAVTAAPFEWSSSRPDVAVVGPGGHVFGVGAGTTTITAALGGYRNTATLRVVPWERGNGVSYSDLATGPGAMCARRASGIVDCATFSGDSAPTFVQRGSAKPFARFASGTSHACGLTADGEVFCAGNNEDGQLLTGAPGPTELDFVPGGGALRFFDVSVGFGNTCLIALADSLVRCGGNNGAAQLGHHGSGDTLARVDGDLKATVVSVGRSHVCAIGSDEAAWCWGINPGSVLGTESVPLSWEPVRIPGDHRFEQISASSHTCAVTIERELYCWGSNAGGQLGIGPPDTFGHPAPARVALGAPVRSVLAGNGFTCVVTMAGQLLCSGMLPLADGLASYLAPQRGTMVPVASGVRFRAIASDGLRLCGLTESGGLVCL